MIIRAIDIKTNETVFESPNIILTIENAKLSGREYILDFEETPEENLNRTIIKHLAK